MSDNEEAGPFATLFAFIGLFAGGAAGLEIGGGWGMLICAIVLAAIGAAIGSWVDLVVGWLIMIVIGITAILINAALRQFAFGVIAAIFSGASTSDSAQEYNSDTTSSTSAVFNYTYPHSQQLVLLHQDPVFSRSWC